ncbi:unnamed protein product [Rangifer tarandus platyrhynchus]|uniref:G-protein coupled receptors family 1 profile domain-containing protein n=3 Tax=Rangifer tarandus platyrhynchus TaxID=3082113 RepID=A0ABN8YMR5_RANTA|nr:unnamed protein product [Rangifer tarandus platyrhynchus]
MAGPRRLVRRGAEPEEKSGRMMREEDGGEGMTGCRKSPEDGEVHRERASREVRRLRVWERKGGRGDTCVPPSRTCASALILTRLGQKERDREANKARKREDKGGARNGEKSRREVRGKGERGNQRFGRGSAAGDAMGRRRQKEQTERSLELGNMTRVQEFILLGLSTSPETREVLFVVFLTLYLLTLLENALIVFLVCSHAELHKPMYFFLGNLSCLEMCYVSVTMPSLLAGLWMGPYHVPFTACMTQLFFFIVLICTECTLLASMAYDRYVAICCPLHYPLLMRPQVCLGLAGTSWLGGLLVSVAKTTCIASLSYCGPNVLNQFFCDVSPLLNLSCTHVALTELVDFLSAIVIFCGTLLVALASYSAIGVTVFRMPSAAARRKAFSTCASHLVVVGIFYSAALFIYCRPSRIRSMDLNKVLSVIYTVATPMCNPVIYCLRNKEVHAALLRTLHST